MSNRHPSALHPRNRHQGQYDFQTLASVCPSLQAFLRITPKGNLSIDFTNPQAIKTLNRALLQHWYGIQAWDIPAGNLCPPIPGRADYIHQLADLLATTVNAGTPLQPPIRVLDIGCGASCIYPLIGQREYGWQFIGSDIEAASLASAQRILDANPPLSGHIELRLQPDSRFCFRHILADHETLELTLCNPPFHESAADMQRGNRRKWKNIQPWQPTVTDTAAASDPSGVLNFGGQSNELWCDGGEAAFVQRMIEESREVGERVLWFTSLVSRQHHIPGLLKVLTATGVAQHRVVNMAQGLKSSRLIAWSFYDQAGQQQWFQHRRTNCR